MADLVYKTRITAPMVRKSYLEIPDSPKPELRDIDEWVEVKYEDAIKLVARELKKTRAQKGMQSIFARSHGWYSSGKLHNPRFYCVEIPFSIATLSNLLGAQRQSVSTIFNKLIKTGKLIKYGKSSYIIA